MFFHPYLITLILFLLFPVHLGQENVTFDEYDEVYVDFMGFSVVDGSRVLSPDANPEILLAVFFLSVSVLACVWNVWIVANLYHSRSFLELRTTTVLFFLAAVDVVLGTLLLPFFIYSTFFGANVFQENIAFCAFQANALLFWRSVVAISQLVVVVIHLYSINVLRASGSLPKPADLSNDVGVVISLYLIISALSFFVLIPDLFLIERKVIYDYRSHHCLYIPYSNGAYSMPFGNMFCGLVLPIAIIVLAVIGIARTKRNEPRYPILKKGVLFYIIITIMCACQLNLPFSEKQSSALETINVFRVYAVGLFLPLLYYIFVREVEDRLMFVKKDRESSTPLRI